MNAEHVKYNENERPTSKNTRETLVRLPETREDTLKIEDQNRKTRENTQLLNIEIAFWMPFGAMLWTGPGNALKQRSGHLLESFSGLGFEMLQNGLLEVFWSHFPG